VHGASLYCAALCVDYLHFFEYYAGDVQGRIRTWFLPELAPDFVAPTLPPSPNDAAAAAAADDSDNEHPDASDDNCDVEMQPDVAAVQRATLLALPNVAVRLGAQDAPTTTAHWHSHAVWCTAFSPSGSFLFSGGEEAVVVVWQVSVLVKSI
jgi:hypothetical protein